MPQLTVRLPNEIHQALEEAAQQMQRKRADVVRIALRRFLNMEGEQRPALRVGSLLGSLESGVPDLAENHREYVLESLRRGT